MEARSGLVKEQPTKTKQNKTTVIFTKCIYFKLLLMGGKKSAQKFHRAQFLQTSVQFEHNSVSYIIYNWDAYIYTRGTCRESGLWWHMYIKLVGEMALAFDPNWTFVRGISKNKHKHIHLYMYVYIGLGVDFTKH